MPSAAHGKSPARLAPPLIRSVHELRIALLEVKPPVWREVSVPSDYTLADLHDVLQLAVGWTNSHLHQFHAGAVRYAPPSAEDEFYDATPPLDTEGVRLFEALPQPGRQLIYEYDFGDGWEHSIRVERILPARAGDDNPRCLAGAGACPPEDCGGYSGYASFLQAIRDPKDPAHEEMLSWGGGWFDPEGFDLVLVNRLLSTYAARRRTWQRGPVPKDRASDRYREQRIDLLARILEARDRAMDKERKAEARKRSRGWVPTSTAPTP